MGTSYALLWHSAPYTLFLMLVFYTYMANEWALLTYCFRRSAPYAMRLILLCQMRGYFSSPYAMFLMFIFQMNGCYLRTAFGRSDPYAMLLMLVCQMCGWF